ncbi:hypothetical protein CBL_10798 [Carabus blaptoides fortunei]
MAQISNVSAVNLENVLKKKRKVKRIKIKKYKKKRSGIKRKDNLYFKRKRLIRSLILRKRLLRMSDGQAASSLVHTSGKRWQQEDEIAFWKARAVSLEYENKMLHNHIKHMHIGMIKKQATSDHKEYEQQYTEEYKETEELYQEEDFGDIYYDCEQDISEDIEDAEFNKESKEFRRKLWERAHYREWPVVSGHNRRNGQSTGGGARWPFLESEKALAPPVTLTKNNRMAMCSAHERQQTPYQIVLTSLHFTGIDSHVKFSTR